MIDDPFDFNDPSLDGWPEAQARIAEAREGAQLMAAFADIGSLEGLINSLKRAEHRDLELVARLAIVAKLHEAVYKHAEIHGDGERAARERWSRWILGPPTTRGLDDVAEGPPV